MTVTYGQPVGELPTAELTGYIFDGWYTEDGKLGAPEEKKSRLIQSYLLTRLFE